MAIKQEVESPGKPMPTSLKRFYVQAKEGWYITNYQLNRKGAVKNISYCEQKEKAYRFADEKEYEPVKQFALLHGKTFKVLAAI